MPKLSHPSDIARETLRQLALRKIPPTPDNYRRLYSEISGIGDGNVIEPAVLQKLRLAVERSAIPPEESRELFSAIERQEWRGLVTRLPALLGNAQQTDWREAIPRLLHEWDRNQVGITQAQKRASVERAAKRPGDESRLLEDIRALTSRWATAPTRHSSATEAPDESRDAIAVTSSDALGILKGLTVHLIETVLETIGDIDRSLTITGKDLIDRIKNASNANELTSIGSDLKRFSFRVSLVNEDAVEMRNGVLHLLQLLVENVSELIVDDQWLRGQIAVVRDLVSAPKDLRVIDDAERRIRDVIIQQSSMKASLVEARDAMKEMLSGFVQRLAHFADDTGSYHDRIESCSKKIAAATDIRDLNDVLREVMQETRSIQLTARRSHDELSEARSKVEAAEKRVQELQTELARASDLVRHDQLTGTLNRRGLEEAFEREISRARRHETAISLAVLDIDDFKKLNDALGHQAGDSALVHLAQVIRDSLRPQDTVARYGGEEFIIIMPDTSATDAKDALVRLQRALTKRFFLHDNQKILITFSAGVTELAPDGTREDAIRRADELMYEAKRAGKNRVFSS